MQRIIINNLYFIFLFKKYDIIKDEIIPNNLLLGNAKIKQCLLYRDKVNFPINILRFAHDIQLYDEVPKQYLQ